MKASDSCKIQVLSDLAARSSADVTDGVAPTDGLDALKGKVRVTRKNLFVDRIACGWLIRRFADETAIFKYVDSVAYAPNPVEIRFDMFEGEYTYEGNRCTFEVMIKRSDLQECGLTALAEVIHDIDINESKYIRGETDGLDATQRR